MLPVTVQSANSVKAYSMAVINLLLGMVTFEDSLDILIRIISAIAAATLLPFTVKKLKQDVIAKKIANETNTVELARKKILLEIEQQKLYQLMEENRKRGNRRKN